MSTPSRSDVVAQLTRAWEQAQSQLRDLRRAVEQTSRLAAAQTENRSALKQKDRAFQELGEAFWKEHRTGKLTGALPPKLAAALQNVVAAQGRSEAANVSITKLLRDSETPAPPSPGRPAPPKKR